MFVKGQKVVCVNDEFVALVRKIYAQLPSRDTVYTVRAVFLGRGSPRGGQQEGEIGILLEEIRNPRDPALKNGLDGELGFNSERFAPLETNTEHHVAVAEEEDDLVVTA